MQLHFQLETPEGSLPLHVNLHTLVIAGWAGRDRAAIEHHIEELAAIGVPRPSSTPLYYRVAANQLTQSGQIQVVGPHSSGEAEAFVFAVDGELYVSLMSDHTDRKLEAHSVAMSKQVCAKPIAHTAWRLADVARHWDELQLSAHIEENGQTVAYQQGELASLRNVPELIRGYTQGVDGLVDGTGMSCGTVAVSGGIRPSSVFTMSLHDPRTGRSITHQYRIEVLPEVA